MPHPPRPLTDTLWVAQSRFFLTNSGLFIHHGEAILIDPALTPAELATLAQFLTAQDATPEALIITHAHWDHLLGPREFPGVPVVVQARYHEVVGKHSDDLSRQVAAWAAQEQIAGAALPIPPQPAIVFADDFLLGVDDWRLELYHAPGHAPDQCIVYEPASGTLWAADQLSDVEIPLISDRLEAYERTLDRLAGLEIRTLIPGHGTPTTDPAAIRTRLAEDRAYLAALRTQVTQAVLQGRTAEETVAACASLLFRAPELNAGYHRWNVESVYLELGGQAGPGTLGWEQEWVA